MLQGYVYVFGNRPKKIEMFLLKQKRNHEDLAKKCAKKIAKKQEKNIIINVRLQY